MISTMVIAPNKKMMISAVLPKWCNNISSMWVGSNCLSSVFTSKTGKWARDMIAHIKAIIARAGISLSTLRLCSKVIAK